MSHEYFNKQTEEFNAYSAIISGPKYANQNFELEFAKAIGDLVLTNEQTGEEMGQVEDLVRFRGNGTGTEKVGNPL